MQESGLNMDTSFLEPASQHLSYPEPASQHLSYLDLVSQHLSYLDLVSQRLGYLERTSQRLGYLEQASCTSPFFIPLQCTVGAAAVADGSKATTSLFTDRAGDLLGPCLLLGVEASLTQREGHIV